MLGFFYLPIKRLDYSPTIYIIDSSLERSSANNRPTGHNQRGIKMNNEILYQRLIRDLSHLVNALQNGTKDEVKESKASVRESETRLLIRNAS
jgi:hypothetical protein